jgi:hypothetical protein
MGYKHESCIDKSKQQLFYICRRFKSADEQWFTVLKDEELNDNLIFGDKYKFLNEANRHIYFGDIYLELINREETWVDGSNFQSFYHCCLNYYGDTKDLWNIRRRSPYIRRDEQVIFGI